jgi:hypothetical protein
MRWRYIRLKSRGEYVHRRADARCGKEFCRARDARVAFWLAAALFYTRPSSLSEIKVGGWCDDAHGPMQVINMTIVHFSTALAEA